MFPLVCIKTKTCPITRPLSLLLLGHWDVSDFDIRISHFEHFGQNYFMNIIGVLIGDNSAFRHI